MLMDMQGDLHAVIRIEKGGEALIEDHSKYGTFVSDVSSRAGFVLKSSLCYKVNGHCITVGRDRFKILRDGGEVSFGINGESEMDVPEYERHRKDPSRSLIHYIFADLRSKDLSSSSAPDLSLCILSSRNT